MNKGLLAINALEDAMSVLADIIGTKKTTPDILERAKLTVNQFKKDFGEEITIDNDGQFWFLTEP